MWTSIRNVKFLKNALEYNVYHRCLCNFLNQTMISFEVFLSLFRLIFLHQNRRFRPRNFQFPSLEHTKRKLLRLLSKFISLQWSLVCSLVEIMFILYMFSRSLDNLAYAIFQNSACVKLVLYSLFVTRFFKVLSKFLESLQL